jgi:hypothetical protein
LVWYDIVLWDIVTDCDDHIWKEQLVRRRWEWCGEYRGASATGDEFLITNEERSEYEIPLTD